MKKTKSEFLRAIHSAVYSYRQEKLALLRSQHTLDTLYKNVEGKAREQGILVGNKQGRENPVVTIIESLEDQRNRQGDDVLLWTLFRIEEAWEYYFEHAKSLAS